MAGKVGVGKRAGTEQEPCVPQLSIHPKQPYSPKK